MLLNEYILPEQRSSNFLTVGSMSDVDARDTMGWADVRSLNWCGEGLGSVVLKASSSGEN
jgi:hypothetical protein